MLSALGYVPISSCAQWSLGAAYAPILLSEVEQEQRPGGNGDREATKVGAGLCDGEGELTYTIYDPKLCEEKYLKYLNPFKRFAGAKTEQSFRSLFDLACRSHKISISIYPTLQMNAYQIENSCK